MKILERYILRSFLSSFVLAFLVLTFVLTIGLMVQIVSYILDGVPMSLVGEFALVSFPETLQWTMPLSLLVSGVLVFSRLSADSEIAAMRACGVNIISVIRWPVVFAIACTMLGVYINNIVVPRGHEVRRTLKSKVTVGAGLDVLEPGKVITDFPNLKLYFGSKEGNWLHDLVVMDYSDPRVDRMITASKALVSSEGRDLSFDLYGVTADPLDADHPGMARANHYPVTLKNALKSSGYSKRAKDFRCGLLLFRGELWDEVARIRRHLKKVETIEDEALRDKVREDSLREISGLKVEFSKRLVFAFASLCFVLVGIPLGIKAQRKESTVGMAISLAISLGYYMVVILMLGLDECYVIRPELLIFLPVVACSVIASRLLMKNM